MNLLTKGIYAIILVTILSTAAVAVSATSLDSDLHYGRAKSSYGADSVWSMNFRAWQPPQPVGMYPSGARVDTAWTDGYTIYYNPYLTSQIPAKVMAFTIAHEYGHIYQRTSNENASDIFAARVYAQTDPSVCQAMVWWMINVPNGGDATHLPSTVRAQVIARECGL